MSFPICTLLQNEAKKKLPKYVKKQGFKTTIPGVFQDLNKCVEANQKTAWIEPEGYETGINIYNSLSKSKVPFRTCNPGLVTWYNCGPTVYDSAHIGHALCFVRLDIIRRILENIFQLNVVQATGITNIDPKIINRATQLNTSMYLLTEKYEKEFFEDMRKLNVLPPLITPRVSDYIPHIHSFIQKIMDKGLAYSARGSVYFDVASYGRSGKFVKNTENSEMLRVLPDGKKAVQDFALWRGNQDSEIFWDSPWGPGIPGWHIECSTMASHIFGRTLDLHSGGSDLMFPHHENEESQCCAYHNCDQWCNYWIHTGFLIDKSDRKMSKSLHNTINVEQFLQDYSSNLFRMICLTTSLRTDVDYSSKTIDRSREILKKMMSFFEDSQAYIRGNSSSVVLDVPLIMEKFVVVQRDIQSALADNFDTKQAMIFLSEFISFCNKELQNKQALKVGCSAGIMAAVRRYVQNFLTTMGLKFENELLMEDDSISEEKYLVSVLDSTMRFRHTVRNFALLKDNQDSSLSKDEVKQMKQERAPLLKASDRMRDEFSAAGVIVKDHPALSSWNIRKETSGSLQDEENE